MNGLHDFNEKQPMIAEPLVLAVIRGSPATVPYVG